MLNLIDKQNDREYRFVLSGTAGHYEVMVREYDAISIKAVYPVGTVIKTPKGWRLQYQYDGRAYQTPHYRTRDDAVIKGFQSRRGIIATIEGAKQREAMQRQTDATRKAFADAEQYETIKAARVNRSLGLDQVKAISAQVTWQEIADHPEGIAVEMDERGGMWLRYRNPDGAYVPKFLTSVDLALLLTEGRLARLS